jgi:negative regulator of sigma E activity
MDSTHTTAISALVDGELGYDERTRALGQLLDDSRSQRSLSSYQLIGACLRGESLPMTDAASQFMQIHERLQQEPTVIAPAALPTIAPRRQHKSRVIAYAAAASVAVLMMLTVMRVEAPQQAVQLASEQPQGGAMTLPPQLVETIAATDSDVAADAEIERYLMGHQIYSSGTINPGFAATMVSY